MGQNGVEPAGTATQKVLKKQIAIGGIFWILTLEFFIGQIIAQAACISPYSIIDNTISELGFTTAGVVSLGTYSQYVNSPLHTVMNISFVATGLLMLLGLYFTRSFWPKRRLALLGLALIALAGIGKIIVGFVPGNVNFALHSLGGLGMVFASIGMILIGLTILEKEHRWIRYLSLILGSAGLVGMLLFLLINYWGGATERLADYPMFIWMIVLGIYFVLLSRNSTVDERSRLKPIT